ncbi:hypothetical protein BGZ63DRAFT_258049 [Mariannaea sp. PMI_226]|nr:hypothetical protein BGZ63DRAFT_258049 [Mariannaea sp. PMI_226]
MNPTSSSSTEAPKDSAAATDASGDTVNNSLRPDLLSTPAPSPSTAAANNAATSSNGPEPIPAVPSPWTLRGDVYFFAWWATKASLKNGLPSHAYSPLESRSEYAAASTGTPVGGLSMVQILRYSESPVGPYDELIVVPGSFEYVREDAQGRRRKKRDVRITRIYVSQKHTCYNGRLNWNVPKHLARFDWTDNPDGSTSVKVYPHDTTSDETEANPSTVPFFQATYKPWRFAPSFPLATTWINFLGISTTLALPPLPRGNGSQGELPGTDRWCSIVPQQYSSRSMVGSFDIAQHRDVEGKLTGEHENFWPGLGRWQYGIKMENAQVDFLECEETWDPPRSNL